MHGNAHPHIHVHSRTCSKVFGVVELCHTSCHLYAVSRVPQSFKCARLVMRVDGKRWDSSISPPTHTEGDRLSRDKTTGCTLLCQHAWNGLCVSVQVCEMSRNHTKLLLTLHLLLSWSYGVFISVFSFSHVLLPPLSLSFFIYTLPPPFRLARPFLFFLHPWRLPKFDVEPSVNQTNIAPSLYIWPRLLLSAGAGCHCDYRSKISLSWLTAITLLGVCRHRGGLCVSVFLSAQVWKKEKIHDHDMFVVYD